MTSHHRDIELKTTWDENAKSWTSAVRGGTIRSRRVATDAAILEAVLALAPNRVLDVGCGEGWLTRALTLRGIETVGIDGSASLIHAAHQAGDGIFRTLSYEELIAEPEELDGPYDAVVCNFALLGENLAPLLSGLQSALARDGHLVVQTVHPWSANGESAYADGWREETFSGFGGEDWKPMPWYFRTLETWFAEFAAAKLVVTQLREVIDPETQKPLSLIFVCKQRE